MPALDAAGGPHTNACGTERRHHKVDAATGAIPQRQHFKRGLGRIIGVTFAWGATARNPFERNDLGVEPSCTTRVVSPPAPALLRAFGQSVQRCRERNGKLHLLVGAFGVVVVIVAREDVDVQACVGAVDEHYRARPPPVPAASHHPYSASSTAVTRAAVRLQIDIALVSEIIGVGGCVLSKNFAFFTAGASARPQDHAYHGALFKGESLGGGGRWKRGAKWCGLTSGLVHSATEIFHGCILFLQVFLNALHRRCRAFWHTLFFRFQSYNTYYQWRIL